LAGYCIDLRPFRSFVHQLGKNLSDEEVKQIVAFLDSLTGRLPANFTQLVPLPSSEFPVTAH